MIRRSIPIYKQFITSINVYSNSITHLNKNIIKTPVTIRCYCSRIKIEGDQSSSSFISKETNNVNDSENFLKLKDDPDRFGSEEEIQRFLDSDDEREEKFLQEKPFQSRKLSTKKYADIIKDLVKKRKIQEAIDVLEIRILKEDRAKPENYIYSLLIGGCGRVGYTKKAFSLFNDLKKRGLKVHPSMYTSLFNSCANSPWPTTDGLERARKLRNLMIEKLYEPNDSNYNAMIKAFGRGGDLLAAFEIVDEMYAKQLHIKADNLNFLLQACISDKNAGFRHALLVWQKFMKSNIQPDIYSFNLMLKCIKECEIGDLETTKNVIEKLIGNSDQITLISSGENIENLVQVKQISSQNPEEFSKCSNTETNTKEPSESIIKNDIINNEQNLEFSSPTNEVSLLPGEKFKSKLYNEDLGFEESSRPNLMSKKPHLGNIISLSKIKTPQDRLLLVGGLKGFLNNMLNNNCSPDIKTFTQLLECIPSTLSAEKELMQCLKKFNVKPDIDFFNILIKKRSFRFDYETAREVLTMLNTYKLRPDLVTYGVLSLGCRTKEEALALVQEMKGYKYRLNKPILATMFKQACYHNNFEYVLELMEICVKNNIKPNKNIMNTLEEFKKKSKKFSNDHDNPLSKSKSYQDGYKKFKTRYKTWMEEMTFDDGDDEEDIHPWKQYRDKIETNVKHYKDKNETSRFKPKHLSKFKVKTSTKVRY